MLECCMKAPDVCYSVKYSAGQLRWIFLEVAVESSPRPWRRPVSCIQGRTVIHSIKFGADWTLCSGVKATFCVIFKHQHSLWHHRKLIWRKLTTIILDHEGPRAYPTRFQVDLVKNIGHQNANSCCQCVALQQQLNCHVHVFKTGLWLPRLGHLQWSHNSFLSHGEMSKFFTPPWLDCSAKALFFYFFILFFYPKLVKIVLTRFNVSGIKSLQRVH